MTLESSVLLFFKCMAAVFGIFIVLCTMTLVFYIYEKGLGYSWKRIASLLSDADFSDLWPEIIRPGLFWWLLLSFTFWFAVTLFSGGMTIIQVITGMKNRQLSDAIFNGFWTIFGLVVAWLFLSSQYHKYFGKDK